MSKQVVTWAVWVGGTVRAFRSERRAREFFAVRLSQYGDAIVKIESRDEASPRAVYAANKLAARAS